MSREKEAAVSEAGSRPLVRKNFHFLQIRPLPEERVLAWGTKKEIVRS